MAVVDQRRAEGPGDRECGGAVAVDADAVEGRRQHPAIAGDESAGLDHPADVRDSGVGGREHRTGFAPGHEGAGVGVRAVGEDLEDQRGPVEQLDLPGAFQIALLHGRHRPVDQDQLDLVGLDAGAQFVQLARSEQRSGMRPRQAHDLLSRDLQPRQGDGEADGLGQCETGLAAGPVAPARIGMQDEGAGRPRLGRMRISRQPRPRP